MPIARLDGPCSARDGGFPGPDRSSRRQEKQKSPTMCALRQLFSAVCAKVIETHGMMGEFAFTDVCCSRFRHDIHLNSWVLVTFDPGATGKPT